VAGSSEDGNESSGSAKGAKFLEQMNQSVSAAQEELCLQVR
jgi:hypothetical protein